MDSHNADLRISKNETPINLDSASGVKGGDIDSSPAKIIQLDPARDFTNSVVLLNRSKRLVLPVPALPDGGVELRFPEGHRKAGEPIYTNKDGSVQKGIVFANKTDTGWQGVQGNGKEAIIINDITETQANVLLAKINEVAPDLTKLTAADVEQILSYARNELGIFDMFDKDLESIRDEMRFTDLSVPMPSLDNPSAFLGYWEVSKDTEHKAVRVEGRIQHPDGPTYQEYEHGAVVVTNGRRVWCVDSGVVARNWVLKGPGGSEVAIVDLEKEIPEFMA